MYEGAATAETEGARPDGFGRPFRIGRRRSGAWKLRRRRTVRLRLTAIYGTLFLIAGAVLLTVTGLLWDNATSGNPPINAYVPVRILQLAQSPITSVGNSGTSKAALSAAAKAAALAHRETPGPKPSTIAVRSVVGQLEAIARNQHSADLRQLLLYSGIALAVMALLTIALSWLTAGRVLRPLRTITARTRDLTASNLHERLALEGPADELGELGETIDQLLERLERSFEAQRQFVANASHELRTPLATMRASLDVALAKPGPTPAPMSILAERLNAELDHVDDLLESFLALARAQRGPDDTSSAVQLEDLVSRALEHAADGIAERSLVVRAEMAPETWVEGSTTLLSRLVENLIDNAVRHNEAQGYLSVRTEAAGALARLVVENGGPVLDPDAVAALGRPFRRLGAERTGSENGFGLGLSIVDAIAETHGGEVRLTALPEGGLTVVVELPLRAAPLVGALR
jgi:hypothetical protein